jgi:hypothetical protein
MSQLGEYFREQAAWRRRKADDYPDDERNLQSAAALESLADYVERPDAASGPAGPALAALEPHIPDPGAPLGGEEVGRVVSRYGFGWAVTRESQHEQMLEELVVLCLADAYEFAGDAGWSEEATEDPTGTLLPCEIAAAHERLTLPASYFRRRRGMTEAECEAWIEEIRAAEVKR